MQGEIHSAWEMARETHSRAPERWLGREAKDGEKEGSRNR